MRKQDAPRPRQRNPAPVTHNGERDNEATTHRAVGLFFLTVIVLAAASLAAAYTGQELAGGAKITIDQARPCRQPYSFAFGDAN
jgi:hypothetical protein